jgi:NAD+ synthetase
MLVPRHDVEVMLPELLDALDEYRAARGFNSHVVLREKLRGINAYFAEHRLRGAVVGVSGGVDSAVVLGLLKRASEEPDSPIRDIVAVSLPFTVDQGATNQAVAKEHAARVAEAFGVRLTCMDLGPTFSKLRSTAREGLMKRADAWADGQLVAYLRTPALYYVAAILTSQGTPALVCGTTNRDEGSYLGFFGKASDGMVDLQIISDLHKCEVYELARLLGVPKSTLRAAPTGDVFDGKTHLEMIGAPYAFVELYTSWLSLDGPERERITAKLPQEALEQFRIWGERIEQMHRYNAHKYAAGNPSRHLDTMPRAVRGGWSDEGSYVTPKETRSLVGEFDLPRLPRRAVLHALRLPARRVFVPEADRSVTVLDGFLTRAECEFLGAALDRQRRLPVGTNGIRRDYRPGECKIGSYRASTYSTELADLWWRRLRPFLPITRVFDQYARTDWGEHSVWKPVGINPALRFIRYETGGELVVHYDAGYDPKDGEHHSLMSLVIYLTDCDPRFGGATRFIRDEQLYVPYRERDFSDWTREALDDEVLAAVNPIRGRALLFDHRLLHDSQPWTGTTPKVIIRTDIMFKKCYGGES